jgi:hypothetical protein
MQGKLDMSKSAPTWVNAFTVTAFLLLFSSIVLAKASSITLSELVQKSPTIVYGHVVGSDDSSKATNPTWVAFETMKVVRGPEALTGQTITLCNSPPPMRDYPDLSKMIGEAVMFLDKKPSGCFDLTHTYVSVVPVQDNRAMTYSIRNQPHDQALDGFFERIRFLSSREIHVGH